MEKNEVDKIYKEVEEEVKNEEEDNNISETLKEMKENLTESLVHTDIPPSLEIYSKKNKIKDWCVTAIKKLLLLFLPIVLLWILSSVTSGLFVYLWLELYEKFDVKWYFYFVMETVIFIWFFLILLMLITFIKIFE